MTTRRISMIKALKMTHCLNIDEALLLTVEDAFHHLEILLPRAFSSAMAPGARVIVIYIYI